MTAPREYKPEFKEMATEMALAGDKPVSQVARELEMPVYTLHNWVKKARKARAGDDATPSESSPDQQARRQLQEQEKRIHELEMENAFLKKAAAYFAREPK